MLRRTFLKQTAAVAASVFLRSLLPGFPFAENEIGFRFPTDPVGEWEGPFELPLQGTTGYASVALPLIASHDNEITLPIGLPFTILGEDGDLFRVRTPDGSTGYVESKYCLVNLPDLIPSIVYNNTNSKASIFRSLGLELKGVTGVKMYDAWFRNGRLLQQEYAMPVLYGMAKKIMQMQKMAQGYQSTLVLYESYRPWETQAAVAQALRSLCESDEEVNRAINAAPYGEGWFISQGLSNHQRGAAMDVSMAWVGSWKSRYVGPYRIRRPAQYWEYTMPSPMHELSPRAAKHVKPVTWREKDAWKEATFTDTMTEGAIRLQEYAIASGLTPISSEWWHFNDLDALADTEDRPCQGDFTLQGCRSEIPERQKL
ncbi:MAG: D-alanyl-D-alanine carboxypeptidase family protein [Lachnospiraceae bacterium]|nr:D-alanyl-D-alanine carboxypeptidase family protein [Lachnospiraceae bacterium]